MSLGLRGTKGVAATPFTAGPYAWDQALTINETLTVDDLAVSNDVVITGDLTVSGSFSYGAVTATSFVNTGTTQLGNAAADTVTIYGNTTTNAAQNPTFIWLGTGAFTTSTGTNTLSGDVAIASGKDLTMSGASTFTTGTGAVTLAGATALNGDTTLNSAKKLYVRDTGLYVYSSADGQLDIIGDTVAKVTAPTVELEGSTGITLDGDVTIDGSHTLTTGTGLTTVSGALTVLGAFTFDDASVTGDFDIQGQDLQATTGTLNISKSASMTTVKGTLNVNEAVTLDSSFTVAGATVLNGTTTLGNAIGDTVTLYGSVASNGTSNPVFDLSASSGAFTTSSGTNTLSGNVVISGTKTFGTGTGAVSLNGDVTVAADKDLVMSGSGYLQGVNAQLTNIKANDGTACLDITDSTGALGIAGSITVATTKDLVMGTGSAIAGDFKAYRDGAGNLSYTFNPGTSIDFAENFTQTGAYTFGTGTGAVSLNGDTSVATTKALIMGTNTAIGGTLTIYRDGAGNKALELIPATSLTIAENTTLSGATTLITGTGDTTISGDLVLSGHIQAQEFTVNAFQYPAPGTDWTPALTGATLAPNKAAKKVWVPLNFLKIGDEIVSYKLVGDVHEEGGDTVTVDCKLVRINKADPITTTDVTDGGITQVTADGNFDVEAVLASVETVATDKQYALEILSTTSNVSGNEAVIVMGAEVKVNRKG